MIQTGTVDPTESEHERRTKALHTHHTSPGTQQCQGQPAGWAPYRQGLHSITPAEGRREVDSAPLGLWEQRILCGFSPFARGGVAAGSPSPILLRPHWTNHRKRVRHAPAARKPASGFRCVSTRGASRPYSLDSAHHVWYGQRAHTRMHYPRSRRGWPSSWHRRHETDGMRSQRDHNEVTTVFERTGAATNSSQRRRPRRPRYRPATRPPFAARPHWVPSSSHTKGAV